MRAAAAAVIRHCQSGRLVIDSMLHRRSDRPSRRRHRESRAERPFCHAVAPARRASNPGGPRCVPRGRQPIRATTPWTVIRHSQIANHQRFTDHESPVPNRSATVRPHGVLQRRGDGRPCSRLRVRRRGKSGPLRRTVGPSSPGVIRPTARNRVTNALVWGAVAIAAATTPAPRRTRFTSGRVSRRSHGAAIRVGRRLAATVNPRLGRAGSTSRRRIGTLRTLNRHSQIANHQHFTDHKSPVTKPVLTRGSTAKRQQQRANHRQHGRGPATFRRTRYTDVRAVM